MIVSAHEEQACSAVVQRSARLVFVEHLLRLVSVGSFGEPQLLSTKYQRD